LDERGDRACPRRKNGHFGSHEERALLAMADAILDAGEIRIRELPIIPEKLPVASRQKRER
jgi:hypothetical protein